MQVSLEWQGRRKDILLQPTISLETIRSRALASFGCEPSAVLQVFDAKPGRWKDVTVRAQLHKGCRLRLHYPPRARSISPHPIPLSPAPVPGAKQTRTSKSKPLSSAKRKPRGPRTAASPIRPRSSPPTISLAPAPEFHGRHSAGPTVKFAEVDTSVTELCDSAQAAEAALRKSRQLQKTPTPDMDRAMHYADPSDWARICITTDMTVDHFFDSQPNSPNATPYRLSSASSSVLEGLTAPPQLFLGSLCSRWGSDPDLEGCARALEGDRASGRRKPSSSSHGSGEATDAEPTSSTKEDDVRMDPVNVERPGGSAGQELTAACVVLDNALRSQGMESDSNELLSHLGNLKQEVGFLREVIGFFTSVLVPQLLTAKQSVPDDKFNTQRILAMLQDPSFVDTLHSSLQRMKQEHAESPTSATDTAGAAAGALSNSLSADAEIRGIFSKFTELHAQAGRNGRAFLNMPGLPLGSQSCRHHKSHWEGQATCGLETTPQGAHSARDPPRPVSGNVGKVRAPPTPGTHRRSSKPPSPMEAPRRKQRSPSQILRAGTLLVESPPPFHAAPSPLNTAAFPDAAEAAWY